MYKSKNQYDHAITITDNIAKFNLLWISFNCYYNLKRLNGKTDKDKINELKTFQQRNYNIYKKFYDFYKF